MYGQSGLLLPHTHGDHQVMKSEIIRAEGYHVPVLLEESVDTLVTRPDGIYIDCTFGGGYRTPDIYWSVYHPGRHPLAWIRPRRSRPLRHQRPRFTFIRSNLTHPPIHSTTE